MFNKIYALMCVCVSTYPRANYTLFEPYTKVLKHLYVIFLFFLFLFIFATNICKGVNAHVMNSRTPSGHSTSLMK